MNQDFKNSTCSENTSTRYEKEISLHHHLVKETKYMKDHIEIDHISYHLGKRERIKVRES